MVRCTCTMTVNGEHNGQNYLLFENRSYFFFALICLTFDREIEFYAIICMQIFVPQWIHVVYKIGSPLIIAWTTNNNAVIDEFSFSEYKMWNNLSAISKIQFILFRRSRRMLWHFVMDAPTIIWIDKAFADHL